MKTISTTNRFYLATFFIALGLALALTACGDAQATNPETPAPRIETAALTADVAPTPPDTANFNQLELVRAVACTDIENREPVNEGEQFSLESGKVWIYSKVKLPAETSQTIQHIYFHEGKEVQTVDLDVKGPAYRTRSYKTIKSGMEGDWEVKIQTEAGQLLESISFSIQP